MSRRWWTLVAVSLATFMTYLDNNIVNVAIPAIQRDLHLSTSGLEWVVSGYILVVRRACCSPAAGWPTHYGRRRLFLLGLGIFTAASLAAGLAGSGDVLIASRAVQGSGAALVTPTTLAIITATFTDAARARPRPSASGAAVGALALAVGPLLGGLHQPAPALGLDLLHQRAGRRRHGIALRTVGESPDDRGRPRGRLDVPGMAISAVALFALTYALIEGARPGLDVRR